MDALTKIFSHLSRDVQIYLFSGFSLLFQSFIIYCNNIEINQMINLLNENWLYLVIILIISYILGHIIYGIFNLINTLSTNILNAINKEKKEDIVKAELDLIKADIGIFDKCNNLYKEYLERYSCIYQMRYCIGISSICVFIIGLIHCKSSCDKSTLSDYIDETDFCSELK